MPQETTVLLRTHPAEMRLELDHVQTAPYTGLSDFVKQGASLLRDLNLC